MIDRIIFRSRTSLPASMINDLVKKSHSPDSSELYEKKHLKFSFFGF